MLSRAKKRDVASVLTTKPKAFDLLRRLPGRTRRLCVGCGELFPDLLVLVSVATEDATHCWTDVSAAAPAASVHPR